MKIVKQIFIVLIFTVFLNGVSVYAEGGDGTGSKDGSFKPLNFKYIQLKDGTKIDNSKGTPLNPEFVLKFDKNIVNMLVWEKNRKCVTLTTGENKKIPIIVSKIDDTVDFDHRQEMYVKPVNPLKPGTTYYIKVSPNLLARNFKSTLGSTTNGKGIKIAFKTKGLEVKQEMKSKENSKENAKENTTSSTPSKTPSSKKNKTAPIPINEKAVEVTEETAPQKVKDVKSQESSNDEIVNQPKDFISELFINNWLLSGTGLLILCWVGFEIFNFKKK